MCQEEKPDDDFCRNKRLKHRRGRHIWCRDCKKKRARRYYRENRDKVRARQAKYREENRDAINAKQREYHRENIGKRRAYLRKKMYGLEPDVFDALLESQGGLCAIHRGEMAVIHVDHDHETGDIRGLLCSNCNTGLGLLGDNIEGLRQALEYLENPNEYLAPI